MMKLIRDFIVLLVLSCICLQTLAISSFSRHDEGTTEGLMNPSSSPGSTTTTQEYASSSSPPDPQLHGEQYDSSSNNGFKPSQYARVVSENHYNDAPKYEPNLNSTPPNLPTFTSSQFIFPGRKLELESTQIIHSTPAVIKLFDEVIEQKEGTKHPGPVTTPRLIKFMENDENKSPSSSKTKKTTRSYYGEFASPSHPQTTHQSREHNTGSHHAHPPQQQQIQQIHHQQTPQQHYYVMAQDTQYSHAPSQGHGQTSIAYLPETLNEVEVGSHYSVPKEVSTSTNYPHAQQMYYSKPQVPVVTTATNNLHSQVVHQAPIVYQPIHSTSHAVHGRDNGPFFGPAFSRALKFWIPSAIFLTGVSALFPNRVKVFTNEQDEKNSRPKRSAEFNSERIPARLLRREHRSDYAGEEAHDYEEDITSPYYQHAEPQRVPKFQYSGSTLKHEIESFQKSIRLAAIESYQPSVPGLDQKEVFGKLIPPFMPMPESTANFRPSADKSLNPGENPYQAFDFLPPSMAPTGASSLQTPDLASFEQKSTSKPSGVPKFAGTPKPVTSTKTKASSTVDGRKVFVVVRSNVKPTPTVGQTLQTPETTSTTAHGSTISTTKSTSNTGTTRSRNVMKPDPSWITHRWEPTEISTESRMEATSSPNRASTSVKTSSQYPAILRSPTSSQKPATSLASAPPVGRKAQGVLESEAILAELVKESQKNSVIVHAPFKDFQNQKEPKKYDLSPDGPVIGLLTSAVEHKDESMACQKRALCELAIRGTGPKATRFETFMWSLATLVPDAFTFLYDLEDVFKAIRDKKCETFYCLKPNLDIQE